MAEKITDANQNSRQRNSRSESSGWPSLGQSSGQELLFLFEHTLKQASPLCSSPSLPSPWHRTSFKDHDTRPGRAGLGAGRAWTLVPGWLTLFGCAISSQALKGSIERRGALIERLLSTFPRSGFSHFHLLGTCFLRKHISHREKGPLGCPC